jgi:hypothetical protein
MTIQMMEYAILLERYRSMASLLAHTVDVIETLARRPWRFVRSQ